MKIFDTLKDSPLHITRFWQSIIFYITTLSIAFIIGYKNPMGPCPDLLSAIPMFILMGTALLSIALIVMSIIKIIRKDKRYILPLLVHISFWIFVMIIFIIDSSKS
jgi:hypothetical protein